MGNEHMNALLVLTHRTLGHLAIGLTASLGLFTAIDFNHTITLGSILIGFVIVVVGGIFTIRSKIASVWREEAEGERAAKQRLEHELAEEKASRAKFDREQQELRHELKDELAGCKAQLKAMEARTDLSAALEAIREMNQKTADAVVEAMKSTSSLSEERDGRTQALLEEIRDKLPSEPIAVQEIHPPE